MRTPSITLLCLMLFFLAAPKLINAMYAVVVAPGGVSFFGLATSAFALLSTYGLWIMRRWGVYMFLAVWAAQVLTLPLFPLDTVRDDLRYWFFGILLVVYLAIVVPHWKVLKPRGSGAVDDADI